MTLEYVNKIKKICKISEIPSTQNIQQPPITLDPSTADTTSTGTTKRDMLISPYMVTSNVPSHDPI